MKMHIFILIAMMTLTVPTWAQTASIASSSNSPRASSGTASTSIQAPTIMLNSLLRREEGQAIFIIPTQSMDVAPVLEDLQVMCRIIDKKVDPRTVGFAAGPHPSATETALFQALSLGGQPHSNTEALYLQDYGVIFFVELPFPLDFSKPEPQEQPLGQPGQDLVWQSVKEETLSGGRHRSEGRSPEQTEAMNREATTAMTETLLHTLKHAANIRSLQRDETIVVRIVGQERVQGRHIRSTGGRSAGYGDVYGSSAYGGSRGRRQAAEPLGPTTLVMRTTKADVDDYSAGTLTYEQFRAKSSIIALESTGVVTQDPSYRF